MIYFFIFLLMACNIVMLLTINRAISVINQWKDLSEQLEKEAEEWKALAQDSIDSIHESTNQHGDN